MKASLNCAIDTEYCKFHDIYYMREIIRFPDVAAASASTAAAQTPIGRPPSAFIPSPSLPGLPQPAYSPYWCVYNIGR